MIYHYDPDEWEPVTSFHRCPWHERNPGTPYAGCTCGGSIGQRQRSPEEVAAIRERKAREQEDAILAAAEEIKARRKLIG